MACDIEPLLDFNVFETKPVLDDNETFVLRNSCNTLTEPFEQYCLIPPASRLDSTTTCSSVQSNVLNASYIFPKIMQGLVQTFEDLPIIYVSFAENTGEAKDEVWIREQKMSPNQILNFDTMSYNGFRPVSPISWAVTDALFDVAILLAQSGTDPNLMQVFSKDMYGIFRPEIQIDGSVITANISTVGQQKAFVAMNESGTRRYALLAGQLFSYNAGSGRWASVLSGVPNLLDVAVFDNIAVTFDNSRCFFVTPVTTTINLTGSFYWQCFNYTRTLLYVATLTSSTSGFVATFDCTNGNLLSLVPYSIPNTPIVARITTTTMSLSFSTPSVGLVAVTDGISVTQVWSLSAVSVIVSQDSFIKRFYNNLCWFNPTDNTIVFADSTSRIAATNMTTNSFIAVLNADPTEIPMARLRTWVFVNGQLTTTIGNTNWTTDFNLYMAFDARMNDVYETTWYYPPSVDPPWYLGTIASIAVPTTFPSFPLVFRTSRHQRYRWVIETRLPPTSSSFAHITSYLQRINDFMLLNDSSFTYETKLYNNANIVVSQITTSPEEVVFDSQTPDQASDRFTFVTKLFADVEKPIMTSNGLYILYKTTTSSGSKHYVLCYNVFNSSQFANWCTTIQLQAQALNQQSVFCSQNMTNYDSQGSLTYLDDRCACIPNTDLFQSMFPGAFSNFDSLLATRMIQNIPCVSSQCAKVFLEGIENTNAFNFAQQQCRQNLTLCAGFLEVAGTVKIRDYFTQQNCGDRFICNNSDECPANSSCFNGSCIPRCTSDVQCRADTGDPLATCDAANGRCLYHSVTQKNQATTKQNWLIISVCLIAVAFILLLILFYVYKSQK